MPSLGARKSVFIHSFRNACTGERLAVPHPLLGHGKVWAHCRGAPVLEGRQIIIPPPSSRQARGCLTACPSTTSRHHHFQPKSRQQPPDHFLLPPMLPFPISFSNFSRLVTNLFFLNKIWLCYRFAQKSANGFLSRSGQIHRLTGI